MFDSRNSKPRVLAILPAVIPSTTLGVIKPLIRLHRSGRISVNLRLEYLVSPRQVREADVVVFCRNMEPANGRALEQALQAGKPVIYELDDDLLNLPGDLPESTYHQNPERQRQLRYYLESANLVRVYATHLQQKLTPFCRRVERVDGPVDWDLVPAHPPPRRDPADQPLRIVYATSRTNDLLSTLFLADIEELLTAYPKRLRFTLWGIRSTALPAHPSVRFLDYEMNYDRFFRAFAASGFDIGLAPLPGDEFYMSKSNNKFREYAACRIAGVYSDVPVYSECVTQGVTGLLVPNTRGAWFHAVERLINDDAMRRQIQEQAQQYARQHYGMDLFCDEWYRHLRSVLSSDQPSRAAATTPLTLQAAASPVEQSGYWGERAARLAHIAASPVQLSWRFLLTMRTRGIREALAATRRALNDLLLPFWR